MKETLRRADVPGFWRVFRVAVDGRTIGFVSKRTFDSRAVKTPWVAQLVTPENTAGPKVASVYAGPGERRNDVRARAITLLLCADKVATAKAAGGA